MAAERAIAAHSGSLQTLAASPTLLAAADLLQRGPVAIIAGPASDAHTGALVGAALSAPDPAMSVLRTDDGTDWPAASPAAGRTPRNGTAAAYLCRNMVCGLPETDPDAFRAMLAA